MPHDKLQTVLTLDAGGTNFVFSAIRDNIEIIQPIELPAYPDDLQQCWKSLCSGSGGDQPDRQSRQQSVSHSLAADYINDHRGSAKFPAFGGVIGSLHDEQVKIPVFINNDGNLFAYGEALAGVLPEVNRQLESAGNPKRYSNLLAVTLGTGFGGGVVINNQLLLGDNGCGGDVWLSANKLDNRLLAEEGVSIRAVTRVYNELTGKRTTLTPKEIYEIAKGIGDGDREAAVKSFETLGEVAGYTIAESLNIVDGIVVIGGGIANAHEFILPSLIREMKGYRETMSGVKFPRLQMEVYNLEDEKEHAAFLKDDSFSVIVPESCREVIYQSVKKIGVAVSRIGTNNAIALGAYNYALNNL